VVKWKKDERFYLRNRIQIILNIEEEQQMRIKHRYVFKINENTREIIEYLIANKIKYNPRKSGLLIPIEIFEDDERWEKLDCLMRKHDTTSLIECVYSENERINAEWLTLRSKFRWEYPQPDDNFQYREITYNNEFYCGNCGCGLIQKESFKIKKTPKWDKKDFLMLFWIEDELFVSDKAVDILKNNSLSGFNFLDVCYAKNNEPIANIKQIKITKILPPSMIIQKEDTKEIINCEKCGNKKYIMKGRGVYCKEKVFADIDVDMVKSSEQFGSGHICARKIFVSNNFYKVVKENKLDRDLVFEPINLII